MPEPSHIANARALEQLAGDLHNLAADVLEPSRCVARSDALTAEGERIAGAVRAVFRGFGR
ncbi:hypothetical protein [Sphingomonas immobilis]|uniref:Uncharacterized protein n=1 Tax=Sphingomonas immobilis TaxID=3063997 RepID=A0ABT9A379_9SPHN|nr:hypothetical protein [Sphingomonas sp. CA1-15]MDO7843441.1 hypothetical protein [Sphingomonas sp. CA1-15]